ncbi:MAG: GldG family protein [Chloroflexi bacterium]|nr:GldG family protein [Chloroflexota bacterium]
MAGKKKNPNAKYALIALIVAGVACVSTGLIGAAKGLLNIKLVTLENTDGLNLALQISIALLVAGLASYAILSPDTIRRFLTGRQARYGSNSLIISLAFAGILIVANMLAYQNPEFLGAPWDWTEDQSNTLAPETLAALDSLPEKVTATAFYTANLDPTSAEELLLKFKNNSGGKFDYKFVNPDLDPVAAREAGVTGDGKILFTMGDTKEIASFASETEFAQVLIRLISPEARAVYFLEGHGEASIEAGGEVSFSIAKSTLESKNYTVSSLNLLATNKIPEDALAIIIAGPMKPLQSGEIALLKEYVEKGGSLVVMEDPLIVTEFGDTFDPLAKYLTSDWGIVLNKDIVIDLENTNNPLQAVSSQAFPHPITQNLSANYIVILPQARSLSIAGATPENTSPSPLIMTTEKSWGETELVSGENPSFDEGKDTLGPLTLAIASENSISGGRVVVFGNSTFATDQAFDAYGNGNMFVNSVDWAAEQEDLINITPREQTQRTLNPIPNWVMLVMILMAVIVVPGIVVVAGISSWLSRRRKG